MIPSEELASAVACTLRDHGPALALYNLGQNPLGFEGLRQVVKEKVARTRGIATSTDNVLITSGSLQGIDLVNQVLLQSGDTVILEEFTYSAAISKLKKLGVHYHGAPLDEGGLRIESLARLLSDLRRKGIAPKYIYTIPTVQNPTGSIMSHERRQQLLALSAEYGVPIFEDECYADVRFEQTHRRPPFMPSTRRASSISDRSPSLSLRRCGSATSLRTGRSSAGCCRARRTAGPRRSIRWSLPSISGLHFDAHVERLSEVLLEKLETLTEAIQEEFGTDAEFWRPQGGLFLWLKLPTGVDVRDVCCRGRGGGHRLQPGPGSGLRP